MSAKDKTLTSANLIFFFPPVILKREYIWGTFLVFTNPQNEMISQDVRFKPCYMLNPAKNLKPERITAAVALTLPVAVALKLSAAVALKLPP